MRFLTLLASGAVLPLALAAPQPTAAPALKCNRDNCLRNLVDSRYSEAASEFCTTYTTKVVTATAAIPTYLGGCAGSPSRVSSACSCVVTKVPLPTGAFDLEGYGKENPVGGAVSGGAGGPTVTVTNDAALVSAIAGTTPRIIILQGTFNVTNRVRVGSNKSLIGHSSGATILSGVTIAHGTNVIIRNIEFRGVLDNDCITIQNTTRVWVDHNELWSAPNIVEDGPDKYDGQIDIIRASDYITVSWNYFHDHWKSSLVGNNDKFRDIDFGFLHITYHHNYWRNIGTRGNAGRFGHQHLFNNFYKDYRYQAIHSRSDNQVLVEGNVFTGDTREALSTYGLVIPEDSPNTSPLGDYELDGYANLGALNDFGTAGVNITQVGTFTQAPYTYKLTPLADVRALVITYSGLNKI